MMGSTETDLTSVNPLVVQPPGESGGRSGAEGRAGEGLRRSRQEGRVPLRDGDPGGQEVHVQSDRLLHHRPVVVAGLAGHVRVKVRSREDKMNYF